MRFSKLLPVPVVALLALASCHGDSTCVYDTDCNSGSSQAFVCVPDSDGWGHCIAASAVFGIQTDAGTVTPPSCGDAGEEQEPDFGFDAGFDAGPDAGIDAGFDAGPDAGSDAGIDGGPDAGDGG